MIAASVWCVLLVMNASAAEKWRFPERTSSSTPRIDSKVHFGESPPAGQQREKYEKNALFDETQYQEDTGGFYGGPEGPPRYPVRVEVDGNRRDQRRLTFNGHTQMRHPAPYFQQVKPVVESDGTLDSVDYCKCTTNPSCSQGTGTRVCGPKMYLCCTTNHQRPQTSEYFNEVADDRPMLLPGQMHQAGPFPAPPDTHLNGIYDPGHVHETALLGTFDYSSPRPPGIPVGQQGPKGIFNPLHKPSNGNYNNQVLVGPGGPTGIIGPNNTPVLVGPKGPTGIIGPTERPVLVGANGPSGNIGLNAVPDSNRPILVGPGGPTGIIGPAGQNPNVLVGPGGPTRIIGPSKGESNENGHGVFDEVRPNESAQVPILVGPGGFTGVIGPRGNQRPILVGPGGPTGIIGPNRGILTGPRGPTGVIGPYGFGVQRRQYPGNPRQPILVGPGGPTGRIGPSTYFGN